MRLQIENLGPIKTAKIDLSQPITLFCGENNTGKTYVSYLIYALMDRNMLFGDVPSPNGLSNSIKNLIPKELSYTPEILDIYKQKVLLNLKTRIDAIYGISSDEKKKMFNSVKILINSDNDTYDLIKQAKFKYLFSIRKTSFLVVKEIGDDKVKISPQSGSFEDETGMFELFLNNSICRTLLLGTVSDAMVFPVERNAVYTFNRELLLNRSLLIDKIQDSSHVDLSKVLQENSKRYPTAIRNNIIHAGDIYYLSQKKSEFYKFADEMEKKLLEGSLSVTKEGDVFFRSVHSKKGDEKIPVHAASSLVKALTPLVFYLRHEAQKNDLIIIDEPEMNLHPNSQVLLTQFFVKMQKQGLRLLISTHSDYIIREFNKCILMGSMLKDKKKLPEHLSSEDALDFNEIKVHLFSPASSRSKKIGVVPIDVDKDGFAIPTIDETIKQQNEETEELFFRLHY